jgi:iron(III) transport system ATP-binding protein
LTREEDDEAVIKTMKTKPADTSGAGPAVSNPAVSNPDVSAPQLRGADVEVQGLHKSFGAKAVLRGVDLTVSAGTLTAVLGPSGCGKTTLLRILAGFDDPDAGTVRIGGHTLAGGGAPVPAHRRRVGLMPQEGALFPHLSVAENIAFGLRRTRRAGRADTVRYWLEVVGLEGAAEARPHELSGGQQQRVALARALAAEPRVLLLDEPFVALDAGLRVRVREEIAAILRAAGTTAVLVTHDQSEALSLADSVVLLMDGRLAQVGAPADIYERPATPAAARFVGATVELPGQARDGVVHTALGSHPARLPVPDGPVVVVLRPEELRLERSRDGVPAAAVQSVRFYGPQSAVQVRLADDTVVTVLTAGDAGVSVGEPVGVRVDGSVLAYPAPGRPPARS